jgi:hypothetical protein
MGNTAKKLHTACKNNDEDGALGILRGTKRIGNYMSKKNIGATTLFFAIQNKMTQVALELIDKCNGDNIGERYYGDFSFSCVNKGLNVLMIACKNKMNSVAIKFVAMYPELVMTTDTYYNMDIDEPSYSYALTYAIQYMCHSDVIFKLIDITPMMSNNCYMRILNELVVNKLWEHAIVFIKRNKYCISSYSKYRRITTPLMQTCEANNDHESYKFMEILPLFRHRSPSGETALIVACRQNMSRVAIKIIEKYRFNVNAVCTKGYSALYWALQNNMLGVIRRITKIYRKKIGKIKLSGGMDWNSFDYACEQNNIDVASALLNLCTVKIKRSVKKNHKTDKYIVNACKNKMESIVLKFLDLYDLEVLSVNNNFVEFLQQTLSPMAVGMGQVSEKITAMVDTIGKIRESVSENNEEDKNVPSCKICFSSSVSLNTYVYDKCHHGFNLCNSCYKKIGMKCMFCRKTNNRLGQIFIN